MPSATHEEVAASGKAPTYHVPLERIVSIEHPCIVKNFDNGLKSLGGEHQLKHVLEHELGDSARSKGRQKHSEPVAGVSLRPDDPFAKKISSTGVETQNVLIKVTVPKWTGRKRKRGSSEAFTDSVSHERQNSSITAPELLHRLCDNANTYTMEAVGVIQDTHRFRNLPDFQIRADEVPIMRELRDHTMIPDYDQLKQLRVDQEPGNDRDTAFPGPSSFSSAQQPYRYQYRQACEQDIVEAQSESISKRVPQPTRKASASVRPVATASATAISNIGIDLTTDDIPQGPSTENHTTPRLMDTIQALKTVLEERPILTIHAASCLLPQHTKMAISQSIHHVAYFVNKGPWTQTIVKYGVDPRDDPKYRFYQSQAFVIPKIKTHRAALAAKSLPKAGHVFDGQSVRNLSHVWQLCDLTDPVLRDLMNTTSLRSECDDQTYGWYQNGTIAKIRVILRDKLMRLMHEEPAMSEQEYRILAALPDRITDRLECQLQLEWHDTHLSRLASSIATEAMDGLVLRFPRRMSPINRRGRASSALDGVEEDDHDDDSDIEDADSNGSLADDAGEGQIEDVDNEEVE